MSWTDVVTLWRDEARWDWLFESLGWMPPEAASTALQALQTGSFCPPSLAARQQLEAGRLDRLSPWGRPPWQRLLQSGADRLIIHQLEHHYSEILDCLSHPTPERDRMLSHSASPDCPAQLAQLVQDLGWLPAEGQPGWAESCLLSGRPLPPARLLDYLGQPNWRELACRQLVGLPFQVALSLLLRAKINEWDRIPKPPGRLAAGLLELARHYPEYHSQILAALAGEPGSILWLWAQTRQPQLRRHWLKRGWTTHQPGLRVLLALAQGQSLQDFPSEELQELQHDGQFSRPVQEELQRRGLDDPLANNPEVSWQALRSLPAGQASEQLLKLAESGWQPRHNRPLFHRLLKLLDGAPIRCFVPRWDSLMETPAHSLQLSPQSDRLLLWNEKRLQIWSYPELCLLGECKTDSEPQQIWFLPQGLLLRHHGQLSCCDARGRTLWSQAIAEGPLALSPCATRLAHAHGQQLRVLCLRRNQPALLGSTDLPEPVISRGPVFVGSWARQTLAWSPDGRWLATTHKEKIQIWEADTLGQLCQAEQDGQVSWVGFHDGYLAAGCLDRLGSTILLGLHATVSLFDPQTGDCVHRFCNLSAVRRVVQDGPRLIVQGSQALYSLQEGRELGRLEAEDLQLEEARHGYARVTIGQQAWLLDALRPERLGRLPETCVLAPDRLLALQDGQLQFSPLQDSSPPQPDQYLPERLRAWLKALQEQS
ncbi:hypothetical protein JST97_09305 [bacterium]|nr:hypothetical protein [bacterium]